ncbi:hypothetical protein ACIP98_04910 [Streptomyces sp. NPDC088354]|uniref:hypothetical protein n=1 Tax=Streptomyces sp. NPDC088354 TaxID=3365856 RepID=UPI003822DD39
MTPTSHGHRALRWTAGTVGALALMALGAAPAGAADPAPGVVLGKIAPIDGVKPGSALSVPISFTNTGPAALDKVWMEFDVTRGLSHTEVPSNCGRWDGQAHDDLPAFSNLLCEFDQPVRPGVVYALEKPVALKVLDHSLYDLLRVAIWGTEPVSEGGFEPIPGTAPAVKLVERPDDTPAAPGSARPDGGDFATVDVTAENTADFQVTGARLEGGVGDTVPLEVKFTNAGPGWVLRDGVSPAVVRIKMPAGTSVAKSAGFCRNLGSATYECGMGDSWVDEHGGQTYDFKLRIDKAVPGAKGSVALAGKLPRPFDTVRSNDTADILLDVAGAGATGGSGSTGTTGGSGTASGGSGTASTGGSGSTSGSTSGSGTGATGGSSTTRSTGTTGLSSTGGALASTGSGSVLPLTAAAAGTLALGAGALLVARRRADRQR